MAKTKRKVTDIVLDYHGKEIKEDTIPLSRKLIDGISKTGLTKEQIIELLTKEVEKDSLTYRVIIHTAMNSIVKDEVLTPTDKSRCYEITMKTFATQEPEYTENEINLIIGRAEKIFVFPLYLGRLKDFLRPKK